MLLKDKIVVIFGGSGAIGSAVAHAIAGTLHQVLVGREVAAEHVALASHDLAHRRASLGPLRGQLDLCALLADWCSTAHPASRPTAMATIEIESCLFI